jgi:hypothetical protein
MPLFTYSHDPPAASEVVPTARLAIDPTPRADRNGHPQQRHLPLRVSYPASEPRPQPPPAVQAELKQCPESVLAAPSSPKCPLVLLDLSVLNSVAQQCSQRHVGTCSGRSRWLVHRNQRRLDSTLGSPDTLASEPIAVAIPSCGPSASSVISCQVNLDIPNTRPRCRLSRSNVPRPSSRMSSPQVAPLPRLFDGLVSTKPCYYVSRVTSDADANLALIRRFVCHVSDLRPVGLGP